VSEESYRQKYCIRLSRYHIGDTERMFRALFSKGFVFGGASRRRTWEEIKDCSWTYTDCILIGYDANCKMALEIGSGNWNGVSGHKEISFDEFIEMIDKGTY